MSSSPPRTALVVGAGIGGLAAAVALKRAGWTVQVFERAQHVRELGFALLLAPNAMLALRALGLEEAVLAGGRVAEAGEIRRGNGELLRRVAAGRVSRALGASTVCVLRPVLHGVLLDAVGHGSIALGSEVVDASASERGATLTLAGGRTVPGDVIVGADGVGSAIRRALHPDDPAPRRSGLFALRGVALDVAQHLGGLSGAQYFGRGLEAGLGRASERAVYWYLSIPADEVARVDADSLALARALGMRFDDMLRAIVHGTAREDLRLDELFDRPPLEGWGQGAVTLLGDAAHPMLPHAGQGAAQAIEDAVALGRALGQAEDVAGALRGYERARLARTRAIAQLARRNARLGSIRSPMGCWARDLMIRLVPDAVVARMLIDVARGAAR